ncbi:MAG: branched-chain amino acid ABC transporter permease [Bdellovibrionaceae bacterium]|nr:branched-chain amino acid ABC transporter permease [Pseudobdellovibrionaceae bacterium]NUM59415.1 branched-chain amino acid ABC transporter permease [Pseudobdellovibrionaceae bacterium]
MEELLQHLINGLSLGSIYSLIALGYTMVYGILQMINFAHSEVYMMGAFFAYYSAKLLKLENSPSFTTLLIILFITMAMCSLLALSIEKFAYRPLRKQPKLNVLITAIGVSLFLQYVAQIIFGADPKVFPTLINDQLLFEVAGVPVKSFDVTILGVSVTAMFALHFLVYHTKLGQAMRAVSHSPAVASILGINVSRTIAFTFVAGSSLAGIGSILVGIKYQKIEPMMGTMIGLKAFVAAVLGGIGSIAGAVVGGLVLGVSEVLVVVYGSSQYRDALAFGILIFILLFKPAGIFGKNTIEKV